MGYDTSGFSWSLGGVGQTEIILWWGFIYLCWRRWSTPCLLLWFWFFYPFGADPPALIWWADPPIFILNHPRLQRMKSLHSGRVQCMCSRARQRTVIGSLIYGWLVRDKWINVTVRGTGCVWSYFIFIYPIGFSEEIFENSFIVITECGVDQPRLSQWHWSDLGAILAQDLISDLFWELSRPPLAPWWFIVTIVRVGGASWAHPFSTVSQCPARRKSIWFHLSMVPCTIIFHPRWSPWARQRSFCDEFYLFALRELIHSSSALSMGQTEIILWWGFIYLCWRRWSTPCLLLWFWFFYPFGADPPALIWWADPPIFILNHPRLQRMKSLHSGRVQCMCSRARQRTVIDIYIYSTPQKDGIGRMAINYTFYFAIFLNYYDSKLMDNRRFCIFWPRETRETNLLCVSYNARRFQCFISQKMSCSSLLRRQHLQFRSLNGNVIIKEKMVGHHPICRAQRWSRRTWFFWMDHDHTHTLWWTNIAMENHHF